ncbi:hypothetical protein KIH87_12320 [Paraneptunicella aestuarii]|uniref:AfsA-related hotdog domain-containing protein n=1 Tax=Paraneptunicella aestuarii TaxID=2831148 RepID=UPI001E47E290|nr:AfsA-related hotdog domain-containing protein [Paraneptunicella aestuarii]UAA37497.1 hypothetical protein KIH87_12320 [Paraneptunicella aestuarii]
MNDLFDTLNIQTEEELSFYSTVLGLDEQTVAQFSNQNLNPESAFDWKSRWNWTITNMLSRLPVGPTDKSYDAQWESIASGGGSRISKEMVHKKQDANVLLSEPLEIGKVLYFNMGVSTQEINFDHPSDHVQGMLIMEALRQTGLATAHYYGVPESSQITITAFNFEFKDVLDERYPILIRLISNLSVNATSKSTGWGAFEVLQAGASCVVGGWEGHFVPERTWKRIRQRSLRKIENLMASETA